MTQYPKWKYHRTLPARIVQDPAAEAALGDGWADWPGAFAEPEAIEKDGEEEPAKRRGRRKNQE